jgi:tellurite resistance protein
MAHDDIWLPLVEEPIGEFVARLQEEDEELAAMVASPRRQLAFRTFAYIRVGVLLGSLLVDHDVQPEGSRTWVDELLADPKHRQAAAEEVKRVAREVAADPKLAEEEEPVGPDDDARERFRRFARDLG